MRHQAQSSRIDLGFRVQSFFRYPILNGEYHDISGKKVRK